MLAILTKLAYRESGISDNEVIKQTTNSRHSCSLNHRHLSTPLLSHSKHLRTKCQYHCPLYLLGRYGCIYTLKAMLLRVAIPSLRLFILPMTANMQHTHTPYIYIIYIYNIYIYMYVYMYI